MERDFSYQKLLFGIVFLIIFYYGDAQNGLNSIPLWIDVHCPVHIGTWIGRRCFKHVLFGIWKMKKKHCWITKCILSTPYSLTQWCAFTKSTNSLDSFSRLHCLGKSIFDEHSWQSTAAVAAAAVKIALLTII